jgi:hypothetical protein
MDRRKNSKLKHLLFLYLIFFIACTANKKLKVVYQSEIKDASNYFSILNNFTQTQKLLPEIEVATYVSTTYHSWDLRKAYIKKLAHKKTLSLEEQEKLLIEEKIYYEKYITFTSCIYSSKARVGNLDDFKIWNIILFDKNNDQKQIKPISLIKLDKDDPLNLYFYPYINKWCNLYEIKFNRIDFDELNLLFSGLFAKATFSWKK